MMTHVTSMEQAKAFISGISKENKNATHHCWAYIVGASGNMFHSSDAGEPSGTAGKPMLNRLQSNNMTNVAVVVTRIFGGIKLGVKGLVEAYGQSVQKTIELEPLVKLVFTEDFDIKVPYPFNDKLLHYFSAIKGQIINTRFEEHVFHRFRVEMEDVMTCYDLLKTFQNAGWLTFDCQLKNNGKGSGNTSGN